MKTNNLPFVASLLAPSSPIPYPPVASSHPSLPQTYLVSHPPDTLHRSLLLATSSIDPDFEFDPSLYLKSKNVIDEAAINPTTYNLLRSSLLSLLPPFNTHLKVADLGCGLLHMLRRLIDPVNGIFPPFSSSSSIQSLEYHAFEVRLEEERRTEGLAEGYPSPTDNASSARRFAPRRRSFLTAAVEPHPPPGNSLIPNQDGIHDRLLFPSLHILQGVLPPPPHSPSLLFLQTLFLLSPLPSSL